MALEVGELVARLTFLVEGADRAVQAGGDVSGALQKLSGEALRSRDALTEAQVAMDSWADSVTVGMERALQAQRAGFEASIAQAEAARENAIQSMAEAEASRAVAQAALAEAQAIELAADARAADIALRDLEIAKAERAIETQDRAIQTARFAIAAAEEQIAFDQQQIAQTDQLAKVRELMVAAMSREADAYENLKRVHAALTSSQADLLEQIEKMRAAGEQNTAQWEETQQILAVVNAQIETTTSTMKGYEDAVATAEKTAAKLEDTLRSQTQGQSEAAQMAARAEQFTNKYSSAITQLIYSLRSGNIQQGLFNKALQFSLRNIGSLVAGFEKLSRAAKIATVGVAGLAAVVGGALVAGFKLATGQMAQAVELMERIQTAAGFTGAGDLTSPWIALRENLNLTEQAALQLQTTTRNVAEEAGYSAGQIDTYSRAVAELAPILATVGGVEAGQAVNALNQALERGGDLRGYGDVAVALKEVNEQLQRSGIESTSQRAIYERLAAVQASLADEAGQVDEAYERQRGSATAVKNAMDDLKKTLTDVVGDGFNQLGQSIINFINNARPLIQVIGGLLAALAKLAEMLIRVGSIIVGGLAGAFALLVKAVAGAMRALVELGSFINSIPGLEALVPDDWLAGLDKATNAVDTFADLTYAATEANTAMAVGVERTTALAQAMETLSGLGELSVDNMVKLQKATGVNNTEMTEAILKTHDLAVKQKWSREELGHLNTVIGDWNKHLREATDLSSLAGDEVRNFAQEAVNAHEKIQGLTSEGFNLLDLWGNFVKSLQQWEIDPTIDNAIAAFQAFDAELQWTIENGTGGIELLLARIDELGRTGAAPPEMIEQLRSAAIEAAENAGLLLVGNEELRESYEKVQTEAEKIANATQQGMTPAINITDQFTADVRELEGAIIEMRTQAEIPIQMTYSITGTGSIPEFDVSGIPGGRAGLLRGGLVPTALPRPTGGASSTALSAADRSLLSTAGRAVKSMATAAEGIASTVDRTRGPGRAGAIQGRAAQAAQDAAQADALAAFWAAGGASPRRQTGGGGGGGGASNLATLEDIRALINEVNRAIRIGIGGGVDVGFAGNVIPALGPDEFLTAQGGGLSIQTLIIRGVWDFTDPAAKRKIIRELEEALKGLKAEV